MHHAVTLPIPATLVAVHPRPSHLLAQQAPLAGAVLQLLHQAGIQLVAKPLQQHHGVLQRLEHSLCRGRGMARQRGRCEGIRGRSATPEEYRQTGRQAGTPPSSLPLMWQAPSASPPCPPVRSLRFCTSRMQAMME